MAWQQAFAVAYFDRVKQPCQLWGALVNQLFTKNIELLYQQFHSCYEVKFQQLLSLELNLKMYGDTTTNRCNQNNNKC